MSQGNRRSKLSLIRVSWNLTAKTQQDEIKKVENYVLEQQAYDHLMENVKVTDKKESFDEAMSAGDPATVNKKRKKTAKSKEKSENTAKAK